MLYNSDLSEKMKKFIINKNQGLIEKKYNKRSFSQIFENHDEALYYQLHFGGRIHTLECKEGNVNILIYEDKKGYLSPFCQ